MKAEKALKDAQDTLIKSETVLKAQGTEIDNLRAAVKERDERLAKAETDLTAARNQANEAAGLVEKFLRSSASRRAITAPDATAPVKADPTAGLTKAEIVKKLSAVIRTSELTKAEYDAVNAFTIHGEGLDKIKPLLERK